MPKKMLIDATHAEETRVVVVDGNRVEEFDFESESKRQLTGNIYLAKVTRVEPSLQAAFVEYGGNRHGFLAFPEIHPDYYQIPVADREALLAEEEADARAEAARAAERPADPEEDAEDASGDEADEEPTDDDAGEAADDEADADEGFRAGVEDGDASGRDDAPAIAEAASGGAALRAEPEIRGPEIRGMETVDADAAEGGLVEDTPEAAAGARAERRRPRRAPSEKDPDIESVSEDDAEVEVARRPRSRPRRYKIQEVVKVRQIMLVQVVKEERGNKGAALTTYLSLAGRYCVLMPNTARGGGISRKITNAADRKKLKEIASEIELPRGAGLIIRTAGAKRTKTEIRRDYEYLQRLWEQVRELTLKSVAPAKIYEEGDLIKRTIRDLYNRDIDEVIVEGEAGYRTARDFMAMIMPSHAQNVTHYREPVPLFARYQVESTLAGMFNPTVQLKSGGYIVVGVTEALVAIDVNSGRATKQGSVEETALATNLEAADEVARQVRLRDLAGLIVVDFIDMDERRNNAAVEKRLKEALKTDRARIQIGRISGFGLLEMSRQRMRPGMIEATTQACPACHGTGLIRSDESLALTIIRQVEEEGVRGRSREVLVRAPVGVVNYLFNHKREHLAAIEARTGMAVRLEADAHLVSPDFSIERFKTQTRSVEVTAAPVVKGDASLMDELDEAALAEEESADAEPEAAEEDAAEAAAAADGDPEREAEAVAEAAPESVEADGEDGGPRRKRRRRRRRRGGRGDEGAAEGATTEGGADGRSDAVEAEADAASAPAGRRGGGRRVRRAADGHAPAPRARARGRAGPGGRDPCARAAGGRGGGAGRRLDARRGVGRGARPRPRGGGPDPRGRAAWARGSGRRPGGGARGGPGRGGGRRRGGGAARAVLRAGRPACRRPGGGGRCAPVRDEVGLARPRVRRRARRRARRRRRGFPRRAGAVGRGRAVRGSRGRRRRGGRRPAARRQRRRAQGSGSRRGGPRARDDGGAAQAQAPRLVVAGPLRARAARSRGALRPCG